MTTKKTSGNKKPTAGTKKTNELQAQIIEKDDKLLRSYADLQNLQKRMDKELLRREQETKQKYLLEFMDVYELLFKATQEKNPKEGVQAILKHMESIIEQENIRVIDCVGKSFDHTVHHAVCTVENNECNDNEIIEEIKKGYLCHTNLLRPAQVVVAKNQKE